VGAGACGMEAMVGPVSRWAARFFFMSREGASRSLSRVGARRRRVRRGWISRGAGLLRSAMDGRRGGEELEGLLRLVPGVGDVGAEPWRVSTTPMS